MFLTFLYVLDVFYNKNEKWQIYFCFFSLLNEHQWIYLISI